MAPTSLTPPSLPSSGEWLQICHTLYPAGRVGRPVPYGCRCTTYVMRNFWLKWRHFLRPSRVTLFAPTGVSPLRQSLVTLFALAAAHSSASPCPPFIDTISIGELVRPGRADAANHPCIIKGCRDGGVAWPACGRHRGRYEKFRVTPRSAAPRGPVLRTS